MMRRAHGVALVAVTLILWPAAAAAEPEQERLRPVAPPSAAPPPPPPGQAAVEDLEDPVYPTSPVGAFALRSGQLGMRLEVGYPFLELAVTLGLVTGRLQIEGGYRGLYGLTNGVYGGLKWAFARDARGRMGLALRLLGGYQDVRKDAGSYREYQNLVGGGYGFGEGSLLFSARGDGNTAFLASAGLRVSEYRPQECDPGHDCEGNRRIAYTVFVELGFIMRIGWRTSYFLAVGVDVFEGLWNWLPALIRFRTGLAVDF